MDYYPSQLNPEIYDDGGKFNRWQVGLIFVFLLIMAAAIIYVIGGKEQVVNIYLSEPAAEQPLPAPDAGQAIEEMAVKEQEFFQQQSQRVWTPAFEKELFYNWLVEKAASYDLTTLDGWQAFNQQVNDFYGGSIAFVRTLDKPVQDEVRANWAKARAEWAAKYLKKHQEKLPPNINSRLTKLANL